MNEVRGSINIFLCVVQYAKAETFFFCIIHESITTFFKIKLLVLIVTPKGGQEYCKYCKIDLGVYAFKGRGTLNVAF